MGQRSRPLLHLLRRFWKKTRGACGLYVEWQPCVIFGVKLIRICYGVDGNIARRAAAGIAMDGISPLIARL
jgi:hypothetical protein